MGTSIRLPQNQESREIFIRSMSNTLRCKFYICVKQYSMWTILIFTERVVLWFWCMHRTYSLGIKICSINPMMYVTETCTNAIKYKSKNFEMLMPSYRRRNREIVRDVRSLDTTIVHVYLHGFSIDRRSTFNIIFFIQARSHYTDVIMGAMAS